MFPSHYVPRLRNASWIRLSAVGVAMLVVCLLVVARSTSAFSGTTANENNVLSTGSVVLSDDDGGSALFTVSGMKTGQTETRCITVTYTGTSAAGAVRLSGTSATSTLSPYLDLVVRQGGVNSTCAAQGTLTTIFDATTPAASAGTLQAFTTNHAGYATAVNTSWTPVTNGTRAYVIAFTVKDDNDAQNKTAQPTFTWEVRGV